MLELSLVAREMGRVPITSQMVGNGQVNGVMICKMVSDAISSQAE